MFLFHDFLPMWAAARAVSRGLDPYKLENIQLVLLQAGVPLEGNPGNFMYPPWSLWFFSLFALFDIHIAKWLWTACSLGTLGLVGYRFRKSNWNRSTQFSWVVITIFIVCFLPVIKLLIFGQSSWLVLLALVFCFDNYGKEKYFRAGLWLAVASIKFHLIIALLVAMSVSSLVRRQRSLLVGLVVGLLIQTLVSLLLQPDLFISYVDMAYARVSSSAVRPTATLLDSLSYLIGVDKTPSSVVILGVLGAISGGVLMGIRKRVDLTKCVILSLALAPFLWANDYVLLLPFYLTCFCVLKNRYSGAAVMIFVVVNLGLTVTILQDWIGLEHFSSLSLILPMALIPLHHRRSTADKDGR